MTGSARSIGSAAPVLSALALVCWLAMLRSIIWWIAKTPEPGRETTKLVSST